MSVGCVICWLAGLLVGLHVKKMYQSVKSQGTSLKTCHGITQTMSNISAKFSIKFIYLNG